MLVGLLFRFLMLLVAYLIVKSVRTKLLGRLNKLMKTSSVKSKEIISDEGILTKKRPQRTIFVKEINENTELTEAKFVRNTFVANSIREFNKFFIVELGVVILYAILPVLCLLFDGEIDISTSYLGFVVLALVWVIMRFIGHRSQFKAYRTGVFSFLSPINKILFFPFQPLWCQSLLFFLMFLGITRVAYHFVNGFIVEGITFIIPVIVHLYTIRHVKLRGRKKNNVKLLILRVFFLNSSSVFTFSTLAKYWKHFGSYFTVADPSFYRVFWKNKFNTKFPIFILGVYLVFTFFTDLESIGWQFGVFLVFTFFLIFGGMYYADFEMERINKNFIHSESQLKQRLADIDKWPVKYDNTFKELPVMCYENTWKIGVSTLVQQASVIMMDLRGFNEDNKGCKFEINFILDHVPVNRILFLCKPEALNLIKRTIKDCWEMLAETSPNHEFENPEATVFISENETAKELQNIMDLLLKAAQNS